ncbi:MAG: PHP domain-containing protein [Lachnospiraceae bacterium]|nr:PHP domain-containing protein [Lachnospiraceae bacterium]
MTFTMTDNVTGTKLERVEFHAHTKMSGFDSVIDVGELIETALKMGHRAVAITDHGCVYALPEAKHILERLARKPEYKEATEEFKIIYGCEGYLVNDDNLIDENGNPVSSETEYVSEIKNRAYTHVTLLCRNETGRKNLYRLVSESYVKYFGKGRPRMPKSLLNKYRDGLLLGSACDMGELFKALLQGKSREVIERIAGFYDYLEIQPVENYAGSYITNEAYPEIKTKEDLWKLNIVITEIAEKQSKLCIAASDAHFIEPADERYRKIARYISAVRRNNVENYKETDDALFFRTTDQMVQSLKEHMDEEKAFTIAVTNTIKISDMIEYISPVGDDGFHPELLSYDKALEYVKDYCTYKNIQLSEEETDQAAEKLSGMRIHLG